MFFLPQATTALAYTLTAGSLAYYFFRASQRMTATFWLGSVYGAAALGLGVGWFLSSSVLAWWRPLTLPYQFLGGSLIAISFVGFANQHLYKRSPSIYERIHIACLLLIWLGISTIYLYMWYRYQFDLQELFAFVALAMISTHVIATVKFLLSIRHFEGRVKLFYGKTAKGRQLSQFVFIHGTIYLLMVLNILFSWEILTSLVYYSLFSIVFLMSTMLTLHAYQSHEPDEAFLVNHKLHMTTIILVMIPISLGCLYGVQAADQALFEEYTFRGGVGVNQEAFDYIWDANGALTIFDHKNPPRGVLAGIDVGDVVSGEYFRDHNGILRYRIESSVAKQYVIFTADGAELGIDYQAYRAQLSEQGLFYIALILGAYLFVLAFSPMLYRPIITQPLEELVAAIDVIESQNQEIELPGYRNDQIGKIGQAFSRLMGRINRYTAGIERVVDQRTEELADAKDAAELANKAKSDFLARMSHELRTPLNGIMGYAQILQKEPEQSRVQRDGAEVIYNSGVHLLALINDILDLAKIEAGKTDLQLHEVDIEQFLDTIKNLIRPSVIEKGLRWETDFALTSSYRVLMDSKRLKQILINLLGNAVKFTSTGSIRFAVSEEGSADSGIAHLRFVVSDTGEGIPANKLETIFQPFEQIDRGDGLLRAEGTGLGLSISQQYAELIGSEIQVESEVGRGTRFWFNLNLPIVTTSSQSVVVTKTYGMISGYSGKTKRILVADDHEVNRAMLFDLLAPLGFEIAMAADGLDAVAQATAQPPDLILMDVVMPKMDGFTATNQLLQIPELSDIPVVAMSANVYGFTEIQSHVAGCDAFLTKPLEVDKLLSVLEELLQIRWIDRTAGVSETAGEESADFLAPPQLSHLQRLIELAEWGDMDAIITYCEKLIETEPQSRLFGAHIIRLAEQFADREIITLIRKYLTH